MEIFQDAFVGTVDILGYNGLEAKLKTLGPQPSGALLTQVFQFLDTQTVSHKDPEQLTGDTVTLGHGRPQLRGITR